MKCGACGSKGRFIDWPCFTCAKQGQIDCRDCGGKYWLDVCPECILGSTNCATCKGTRLESITCNLCNGTGLMPSIQKVMAAKGFRQKCRKCINATGKVKVKCGLCSGAGKVTCSGCQGGAKSSTFRVSARDLYNTRHCRACDGSGWPVPGLAIACHECLGLGYAVLPANAPDQTLFKSN